MTDRAVIAANRFGLGARPGELASIGGDPKAWLKAQLAPANAMPAPVAALSGTTARLDALPAPGTGPDAQKNVIQAALKMARQDYPEDAAARLQAAIATETPLVERLVAFWSNHFTISAVRPLVA